MTSGCAVALALGGWAQFWLGDTRTPESEGQGVFWLVVLCCVWALLGSELAL